MGSAPWWASSTVQVVPQLFTHELLFPPCRYLIPCSHVMLSQKRAVKELDLYGKAAAKFLSLIPRCCCPESLPTPEQEEERAAWSKGEARGESLTNRAPSWGGLCLYMQSPSC